jgi:hypothetical protein
VDRAAYADLTRGLSSCELERFSVGLLPAAHTSAHRARGDALGYGRAFGVHAIKAGLFFTDKRVSPAGRKPSGLGAMDGSRGKGSLARREIPGRGGAYCGPRLFLAGHLVCQRKRAGCGSAGFVIAAVC